MSNNFVNSSRSCFAKNCYRPVSCFHAKVFTLIAVYVLLSASASVLVTLQMLSPSVSLRNPAINRLSPVIRANLPFDFWKPDFSSCFTRLFQTLLGRKRIPPLCQKRLVDDALRGFGKNASCQSDTNTWMPVTSLFISIFPPHAVGALTHKSIQNIQKLGGSVVLPEFVSPLFFNVQVKLWHDWTVGLSIR